MTVVETSLAPECARCANWIGSRISEPCHRGLADEVLAQNAPFRFQAYLVDAAHRIRAGLTCHKFVVEDVIDPEVRAAVRILIEQREEPWRGDCLYCVVLNHVIVAAQVHLDAVTEHHEDVAVCNEIVVGLLR